MPTSRTYWETRFDSAARRRPQSRAVISDIDVSARSVGVGGTINGYATTRYRVTTRYTETPVGAARQERRKQVQIVEDVWVPDGLSDVPDPMQAYLRLFPGSATVGELVEAQARARRKLFTGLPIRTTWVYTQTSESGATASRSLAVDVLHLKRVQLDPAAFRVPDDYRRIDVAALVQAADLLLNGVRDASKESAQGRQTP